MRHLIHLNNRYSNDNNFSTIDQDNLSGVIADCVASLYCKMTPFLCVSVFSGDCCIVVVFFLEFDSSTLC